MKKLIMAMLPVMLLLFLSIPVFAAGSISVSNDRIELKQGQNEAVFEVTITNSAAFAGAEFGLQCGEGVTVKEVSYNVQGSKTSPTNARGLTWFSFFSGSNTFTDSVTAKVTVTYSGEQNSSVALQYVSVYHRAGGAVEEDLLQPRQTINLVREGAENTAPPLEVPDGAKPGVNPDGQPQQQRKTDASKEGAAGGTTAGGTQNSTSTGSGNTPTPNNGSTSQGAVSGVTGEQGGSSGSTTANASGDNIPEQDQVNTIQNEKYKQNNNFLVIFLSISLAGNLVLGSIIINNKRRKHKRKKEGR